MFWRQFWILLISKWVCNAIWGTNSAGPGGGARGGGVWRGVSSRRQEPEVGPEDGQEYAGSAGGPPKKPGANAKRGGAHTGLPGKKAVAWW